ncbi:MAG TPA: acetylglucosamine transferase [Aquabacterium sp.]|nr:acetylglucosamine transferase [Aquabacterium sp.]
MFALVRPHNKGRVMDMMAEELLTTHPDAPAGMDPAHQSILDQATQDQLPLPELLNHAQVWLQAGHKDAAHQLYETWCAHTTSPQKFIAMFNWGTLLGSLSRTSEAIDVYKQALQIKPDFVQAKINLGHQLEVAGQVEAALTSWRESLDILDVQANPDESLRLHALNNLARALETAKRYDESEGYMVRSLQVDPLQPKVIQHYVHIRQKQCEWPVYKPVGAVTPNQLLTATSPLAMLSESDDPAMQLMSARTFVHDRVQPVSARPLAFPKRQRPGPLRVAYLSGDLCLHAVGLLIPELLELHDRSKVEVFGFCWSRDDGTSQRKRLVEAFDHHIRIGQMDDLSAAKLIASCDIDILIDLHGITSGARPDILGYRPARVQLTYLGFPATTAIPAIDYVICDRYVVPPELVPMMSEKPLYMPNCYQISDRKREVGPMPKRSDYDLPDNKFVFCSFNNNFKFTDSMFALWMRVLSAVPDSVLWLLADNPWAKENMLRAADAHGVSRDRLIFAPRVSPADYLARFQLADLFLDTFPYNAGTTANDVLFMGTPILTYSGKTFISRMAGSLLENVGLPDLITTSPQEYERKAIQLGRNPKMIASYKRYLAEHRMSSPLFDIPGFVKDLERNLETIAVL